MVAHPPAVDGSLSRALVLAHGGLGYREDVACAATVSKSITRAHLRSLWIVIGLQGLIILALWIGWSQAPKQLRVYVPPDLRSGAVLAAEEVPPANVYAFAFYIFQQLNRWPDNGATDYGSAIFRISPYLTPRYRNDLIADMELKARRGELTYRVRGVHEVPGMVMKNAASMCCHPMSGSSGWISTCWSQ